MAHLKIAADTMGKPTRFGFVEMAEPEQAQAAILLNGSLLADRPLKISKANNSIFKPSNVASSAAPQKDLSEIMKKVLAAKSEVDKVVVEKSRSRSRSRSGGRRRRRSRSRSRDRSRRDRDRDRDRDRGRRDRDRRSSRSRSRSRGRVGDNAKMDRERPKKKEQPDHTGMFFDGYTWNPIADLENPAAAGRDIPITTQAAFLGAKGLLPKF